MVLWQITGADAVSGRHASVFEERCRPARLFNRCGEREEKQEAAWNATHDGFSVLSHLAIDDDGGGDLLIPKNSNQKKNEKS